MKTNVKFAAMLVGLLAFSGCTRLHTKDLVAKKLVTVEVGKSDVVEFSGVMVKKVYDDLIVSGNITRKAGVKGVIPGHILITINSSETGAEEGRFTTLWKPSTIPMTGTRQSTFIARYGALPEEGAVIKVSYDKNDTDDASAGTTPSNQVSPVGPINAPVGDEKATPNTGTPAGNSPAGIPARTW